MAGKHPAAAVVWLRSRTSVLSASARSGTITIHFRDGRIGAILPARSHLPTPPALRFRVMGRTIAGQDVLNYRGLHGDIRSHSASKRAIVLEPFADELGLGPDAGAPEVAALQHAGFTVDVQRNNQVTVASLEHLGQYSVIYFDTHSGVLDNGDAVVMTDETDTSPYAAYYHEHSLVQAYVAGDPSMTLYNGITGQFLFSHIGPFPTDSFMFLNGCSTLAAPEFWTYLHNAGINTLVSWNEKAQSATNELAAQYLFGRLAAGDTVGESVQETLTEGLGTSVTEGTVATIGFRGWGDNSLADVLSGTVQAVPLKPTATPTPTAVVRPASSHHGKCRPGHHRVHGRCRVIKHKKRKP